MKRIILTGFILLLMNLSAFAQVDEKISELNPYANYLESVRVAREEMKKFTCIVVIPQPETSSVNFFVGITPFKPTNGKEATAIIIRTPKKNLAFGDIGDKLQAKIKIFVRITSIDKKIDGIFEDEQEINASESELKKTMNNDILYRKLFDLPAGTYSLRFLMRDILTGVTGNQSIKFIVP